MKHLLSTLTCAALFCFAANAQTNDAPAATQEAVRPSHGHYIFGYGGLSFSSEFDSDLGLNLSFATDGGFIAGGGLGKRSDFLGGTRFEIEGLFASSDLENLIDDDGTFEDFFSGFDFNESGDVSTSAVMFNALKEIPIGQRMTGFIGGGLGVATIDIDVQYQVAFPLLGLSSITEIDISNSTFAYQFIAGSDFAITNNLDLFIQYKLLGLSGFEAGLGAATFENASMQSVSGGLRLSF